MTVFGQKRALLGGLKEASLRRNLCLGFDFDWAAPLQIPAARSHEGDNELASIQA